LYDALWGGSLFNSKQTSRALTAKAGDGVAEMEPLPYLLTEFLTKFFRHKGGGYKHHEDFVPILPTLISTSLACAVGPSVNSLQNRETQHVNIVLQCMYRYFEQPNMKGHHA
jgi:hypothetical protein